MNCCATCTIWVPDRPIGSLMRIGGRCYYKGETKMDYNCWAWKKCTPEQEEERRKTGLIE